jgi:acyl carrier protein
MDDMRKRLISCFELVFPDLPVSEIPSASQASLSAWDSVAAITMVNVVEDEFNLQIDLDILADLDTFERILAYLETEVRAA